MEKFGIFELLDALSALTAAGADDARGGQGDAKEEEKAKDRPFDPAFDPPAYGQEQPHASPAGRSAYDGFLARHEAAKGRAKKG